MAPVSLSEVVTFSFTRYARWAKCSVLSSQRRRKLLIIWCTNHITPKEYKENWALWWVFLELLCITHPGLLQVLMRLFYKLNLRGTYTFILSNKQSRISANLRQNTWMSSVCIFSITQNEFTWSIYAVKRSKQVGVDQEIEHRHVDQTLNYFWCFVYLLFFI